jgi:hypothetical protein
LIHSACVLILLLSLVLLAVSFATSDRGRTLFGPPLGADYTGFYMAATILNRAPERLYDRDYNDEVYHELFPNLPPDECLPYLHPPFVAAALRPLARLPYELSFALWLLISGGLCLGGLAALWSTLRAAPASARPTVFLLALAFEPFVMECWQGGQLSAVGFCCFALALACEQRGASFGTGLALGLCCYKPTLLVLALPLLVVARRYRAWLGFLLSGLALAGVSVLAVGLDGCLEYAQKLLGFAQTTTQTSPLVLRTWKYIDLNSFVRLLLGGPTPLNLPLVLALAAVPLGWLLAAWWRYPRADETRRLLTWAATLTGTLVLNLYVGVYDSVLAVLAALLTAEVFWRRGAAGGPPLPFSFRALLLLLFLAPWVTLPLARLTRFQAYTAVLFSLTLYPLLLARRPGPRQAPADLVKAEP